MSNKSIFYVTTPIYYPNDIPHLGHAYTSIAADVLARFHRSLGDDVLFSTGTDEHGQKIENAAKKAGKETKEFVDNLIPQFKEAWKVLNISYDDFIRTTEYRHKSAVIEILKRCYENGDIYKGNYEGLYCLGCEAFYLEKDLDDGKCKIHKTKVEVVKEESYFFRLSGYQEKLLDYYEKNIDFLSPYHKREEIINRVKEGLNDLSITRTSFKWGIPFPYDEKHVIYVWFDALTNYITCAGFPDNPKKFEEFWPASVHLVGKDIMWFHQVIWPAMLMSAKLALPKKVFAHGWWTVNGEKMSKSIGNVISPIETSKKFGADELRYFLLREASFGEDGDYSEKSFIQRINSDLADDLGNLLSRALTLIEKNFESVIPQKHDSTNMDEELMKSLDIFEEYQKYMDSLEFNNALSSVWRAVQGANKYINDAQPWKIEDKKRLGTVLYNVAEALRIISIYIEPFMPTKAYEMRLCLGVRDESFKTLKHHIKPGLKTVKGNHLFKKYDIKLIEKEEQEKKNKEKVEKEKEKKEINKKTDAHESKKIMQQDFSILNLKVGKIVDIKMHPNADKLYIEQIDFGTETRQILSGLRGYYAADELLGKKVVVVTNLKTAKIRGLESQGMLLASEEDGKVGILFLEHANVGENVSIEGVTPSTKEIVYEEFAGVKMEVKYGVAYFENSELKAGSEKVKVERIKNGPIR